MRIKKISEVVGKHVYTSEGDYFGQVEEVNLMDNKIDGWKVRVGSGFMSQFGGARGAIIPHQFVKAIGDVMVINSTAFKGMPSKDESAEMPVDQSPDLM